MKKLLYTGLLLLFTLSACNQRETDERDGIGISFFAWTNASDHNITLTVIGQQLENKQIASGETLIRQHDGFIDAPTPIDYLRLGVTVLFDDGPYGGIFNFREDKKWNPAHEDNYPFVEFSGVYAYTYTFTNADYDAAVARGPMEQMPE